jgi:site-specific DNA-adenine methylase
MKFIGSKQDLDLYENLIKEHLPEDLGKKIYVEPFGGSFGLAKILEKRPKKLIYNDNQLHDVDLNIADEIYHVDYKEILNLYDSSETVFYLDPPYYGKEQVYGMLRKNEKFHEELRQQVKNRKSLILISYEDCPYIRKLYKNERMYSYCGINHYKKSELLIVI